MRRQMSMARLTRAALRAQSDERLVALARAGADDDGFTLIELLVVILIRDPLVARRRGGAVDRA